MDEHCLLVVIFGAHVGVVKYFATGAVQKIARQLKAARERDPGEGVDLSMLNVADTRDVFRKKKSSDREKILKPVTAARRQSPDPHRRFPDAGWRASDACRNIPGGHLPARFDHRQSADALRV